MKLRLTKNKETNNKEVPIPIRAFYKYYDSDKFAPSLYAEYLRIVPECINPRKCHKPRS